MEKSHGVADMFCHACREVMEAGSGALESEVGGELSGGCREWGQALLSAVALPFFKIACMAVGGGRCANFAEGFHDSGGAVDAGVLRLELGTSAELDYHEGSF